MRSRLFNVLIPMTLLAATAVPTDPARAEGVACPRAAAVQVRAVEKAAKPKAVVEKNEKKKDWKLEAI